MLSNSYKIVNYIFNTDYTSTHTTLSKMLFQFLSHPLPAQNRSLLQPHPDMAQHVWFILAAHPGIQVSSQTLRPNNHGMTWHMYISYISYSTPVTIDRTTFNKYCKKTNVYNLFNTKCNSCCMSWETPYGLATLKHYCLQLCVNSLHKQTSEHQYDSGESHQDYNQLNGFGALKTSIHPIRNLTVSSLHITVLRV